MNSKTSLFVFKYPAFFIYLFIYKRSHVSLHQTRGSTYDEKPDKNLSTLSVSERTSLADGLHDLHKCKRLDELQHGLCRELTCFNNKEMVTCDEKLD